MSESGGVNNNSNEGTNNSGGSNKPEAESPSQLDSILKNIQQKAKEKGLAQEDTPISIQIRNTVVYKGIPGQEPATNRITPEQVALLQKAIQDPASISGTVKVSIGGQEVFKVQDRKLVTDTLGLASPQPQKTQEASQPSREATASIPTSTPTQSPTQQPGTAQSPTNTQAPATPQPSSTIPEATPNPTQTTQSPTTAISTSTPVQQPSTAQASSAVQTSVQPANTAQTPNTDVQSLRNELADLRSQVAKLTERVDQFEKSPVVVNHQPLSQWLDQTRGKIAEAGKGLVSQLSNRVENLRENIASKFKQHTGEIASGAVEAGSKAVVKAFGEKLPDGSVVLESAKASQRFELSNGTLLVAQRPETNPQKMWEKYTNGLEGSSVLLAEQASRRALRDRQTKPAVKEMLTADPQYQKIVQQHGPQNAQRYLDTVFKAAVDKEQKQAKSQSQQKPTSQQKERQLQR